MYTPYTSDEDYDAERSAAFSQRDPIPEMEFEQPVENTVDESQPQEQSEQPQGEEPVQQQEQTYADIQQQKADTERPFDVTNPADYGELITSPGAGVVDFAIDAANNFWTPWDKDDELIPPLPRGQTDLANGLRDIAAVLLPTIGAAALATKGQTSSTTAIGNAAVTQPKLRALARIGQDGFFKWFTRTGLGAGAGATVTNISKVESREGNAQRAIRDITESIRGEKMDKDEPTLWFFPAEWATEDDDSPDQIRAKNRNEGIGMGVLSDILGGVAKFMSARRSIIKGLKYVPEDEQASKYFNKKTTDPLHKETLSDNPIEDIVYKQVAERDRQLDELGAYRLGVQTRLGDLDRPIKGVHKDFEPLENGVRSADPDGVVGAAVDAARIKANMGTRSGRLRNVITEAAKQHGLEATSLSKRKLVKAVADQIKKAGNYGYRQGKFKLSWKNIHEAGTELMETIMDPLADAPFLQAVLKEFSNTIDGEMILDEVGYDAASRALKGYMKEYLDMDELKASAYLQTSFAGELSDLAGSAERLQGSAAVAAAREVIFDRLKFLMVETGISKYQRGYSLANANWWQRLKYIKDPTAISDQVKIAEREYGKKLASLIEEAEQFRITMEAVQRERPELLDPFMKAFDYSDGDVNTIAKLQAFMKESFAGLRKYGIDSVPKTPSLWVQVTQSLMYNSVLSAFATSFKALIGNSGGILERPSQHFIGAMAAGDMKNLKKGWYMYMSLIDTMQVALPHAWKTFMKASKNPDSVSYIMRQDYATKNHDQLKLMESYAEAEKIAGNEGPAQYLEVVKPMLELSKSPVSRLITNSMTGYDALVKGMIASAEAKREIWENSIESLRESPKAMNQQARKLLQEKFFKGDMIKDGYVDYISGEIALNLGDGSLLGAATDRLPILRHFIMFPKTTENVLESFLKRSPVGILSTEFHKYGKIDQADVTDELVQQFFTERGIQSVNKVADYQRFLNEQQLLRGRIYISTAITTAGLGYVLTGNVRGNGHPNKPVQKTRDKLEDYRNRTLKVPNTKDTWISGEPLGPMGDWLFVLADIVEAMSVKNIDPDSNLISNMMYLLAANFTNRSILSNVEPLLDVLSGNQSAFNRWLANTASSQLPMSGQRAELSRAFTPQLRVVEEEFFALLKNRNNIADFIDPDGALPFDYDYIDGGEINDEGNLLTRFSNGYTNFKLNGGLSKRKQFLLDYEFDGRPQFTTGNVKVKFTPQEESLISNIIGKYDLFGSRIDTIMKDADNWGYGKGLTKENFDDFMNIQNRLHSALGAAVRSARFTSEFKEQFGESLNKRVFEANQQRLDDLQGLPRMYK